MIHIHTHTYTNIPIPSFCMSSIICSSVWIHFSCSVLPRLSVPPRPGAATAVVVDIYVMMPSFFLVGHLRAFMCHPSFFLLLCVFLCHALPSVRLFECIYAVPFLLSISLMWCPSVLLCGVLLCTPDLQLTTSSVNHD